MAEPETETASGFSLTRRVAGMPMVAWIAVAAAGGVVFLLWWRNRSSAAPGAAAQTMTPVDTGIQGSDLSSIIASMQGPASTSTTPETNDDWARKAVQWISDKQSSGVGVTPVVAQVAISDYLNGKPLGDWEQWTINTIISGTNQSGKNFGPGIGPPPNVPTSGGFR